jgi:hypothetical protein
MAEYNVKESNATLLIVKNKQTENLSISFALTLRNVQKSGFLIIQFWLTMRQN